ncbi:unnamed protein product [Paramecium pentaurelia]|uniref:Ubiquitin-like protease family profile domain-containing protein n=1 Tax=Paramecium pentaurelia TaxID=43138 RepID=A0A8S1WL92_9CILI|nr:unnamed protein product [Paramecium pentaurelia]
MIFCYKLYQQCILICQWCGRPKKKSKSQKQIFELLANNNINLQNNNCPNSNEKYIIYLIKNIKIKATQNELLFHLNNQENQEGLQVEQFFHYKVEYDQDYNPKFYCYEGEMKNSDRHGYGISYYGKSEEIEYEGKWFNGQKEQIKKFDQQRIQDSKFFHQKIKIMENGVLINNLFKGTNQNQTSSRQIWIKFNQQISQLDLRILQQPQTYFTSNIIDAYASYLTIKNEQDFFQGFNQTNIKRKLFLPSSLFTNMWQNNNSIQKRIFQNYLLEYKYIDYQIIDIYQSIYFVINQEFHWYLVKIMKEKVINEYIYKIEIFDSIRHYDWYYKRMIKILSTLFNNLKQVYVNYNFNYLQKNTYDCGPWTCLNMKLEYLESISIQEKCQYNDINVEAIKLELFNLLKNT